METGIILTILLMALVTYLPRAAPLLLLARFSLPGGVVVWLRYVPVAVLSALLYPSILLGDGQIDISLDNEFLLASLPTLITVWRTKSLFWAIVTGIVAVTLLRWWGA
jgi:branched-subunit amino acid transport protein